MRLWTRPMHASDITAAMREAVGHLPPDEAAAALVRAWDKAASERERRWIVAALLVGLSLGVSLMIALVHS